LVLNIPPSIKVKASGYELALCTEDGDDRGRGRMARGENGRAMRFKAVEELIGRVKAGDSDAFAELTRRYQNMALAYAVGRLGDFHLAEDAVQEAFIAVYYGLGNLLETKAFPGWLRGIVRHQCQRILRRHPESLVPLEQAETLTARSGDPVKDVEQQETAAAVIAAVMSLPADQRDVVVPYYFRDHSQREIAAFLGIPIATVNNRLYAARTRLKRKMVTSMAETFSERKLTDDFARRTGEIVKVRGPLVDVLFHDDKAHGLFDSFSLDSLPGGGPGDLHIVQRLDAKLSRCVSGEAGGLSAGLGLTTSDNSVQGLSDALLEATMQRATGKRPEKAAVIETGIKVIDLLSPLTAGGSFGMFGGAGNGKMVLLSELVRRLAADACGVSLFYLVKPNEIENARHMVRTDADFLAVFGASDKVGSLETFWLLTDRATDPDYAASSEATDASVFCSPLQAVRGIWPAIDPLCSRSRLLTAAVMGEEHRTVAMGVLDTLRQANALMTDARFLEYAAVGANKRAAERAEMWIAERLPQLSVTDRLLVERARKLGSFFAQPFLVAEPYNGRPGATVPLAETVAVCRDILSGHYDDLPASAFHFVGGIEEVKSHRCHRQARS
jgi:RNA polymerase sigma factor (sigma-70 family)